MTQEEELWQKMSKQGAAASRKKWLRLGAAGAVFVAIFLGIVLGFGSFWADRDAAEKADREARLARGETVIVVRPRGETEQTRSAKQGFFLVVVAALLGAGGALGTFVVLGGKLSAEHVRTLKQM